MVFYFLSDLSQKWSKMGKWVQLQTAAVPSVVAVAAAATEAAAETAASVKAASTTTVVSSTGSFKECEK